VGKSLFARWRGNFITGVAVLLPAVASIVVLVWFFRSIANVTDTLLFFLPGKLTHRNGGEGPMYWYWSLAAFVLAVLLITLMGRLTRYYVGVKLMELLDQGLLRIPLLNKIYGTIKQVNEAFTSNKSSFKQVVLVEFPRRGQRSVGFVTGEQANVFQHDNEKTVSVFIPTTPNPTSGFMVLVPESEVTKLDMSVADGIKFIVSLGAIPPEAALASRRAEITATPLVESQTPRALTDKQEASPTADRQDACPTTHG
jgi:uncharacterized membrane protein